MKIEKYLTLSLILLSVVYIFQFSKFIPEFSETKPLYDRTDFWLNSSECALETAKPLMICGYTSKGQMGSYGIENLTDPFDRGMFVISSFYALILNKVITPSVFIHFYTLFNLLALIIVAVFLYRHFHPLLAGLLLFPGIDFMFIRETLNFDNQMMYTGLYLLSLIPSLVLIKCDFQLKPKSLWLLSLMPGFIQLFREPFALGSLIVLFAVLLFSVRTWWKTTRKTVLAFAVLSVFSMVWMTPSIFLMREVLWNAPVKWDQQLTHGIAHSLVGSFHPDIINHKIPYTDPDIYEIVVPNRTTKYPVYNLDYTKKAWKVFFEVILNNTNLVLSTLKSRLFHHYRFYQVEDYVYLWPAPLLGLLILVAHIFILTIPLISHWDKKIFYIFTFFVGWQTMTIQALIEVTSFELLGPYFIGSFLLGGAAFFYLIEYGKKQWGQYD